MDLSKPSQPNTVSSAAAMLLLEPAREKPCRKLQRCVVMAARVFKKKKIDYIKKVKEEKTEENEEIPYMAKALELSEREVKQYIEMMKQL